MTVHDGVGISDLNKQRILRSYLFVFSQVFANVFTHGLSFLTTCTAYFSNAHVQMICMTAVMEIYFPSLNEKLTFKSGGPTLWAYDPLATNLKVEHPHCTELGASVIIRRGGKLSLTNQLMHTCKQKSFMTGDPYLKQCLFLKQIISEMQVEIQVILLLIAVLMSLVLLLITEISKGVSRLILFRQD